MCFDIVFMYMCFHVALCVYIVGVLGRWVRAVCRLLVYVFIVCGVWGFFCFVFCVGVVGRGLILSYVGFVWLFYDRNCVWVVLFWSRGTF